MAVLRRRPLSIALLTAALLAPTPATAASDTPARPAAAPASRCVSANAFAIARHYAGGRPGDVSLAVFEHGAVRSSRGGEPYRSASIVKAMLLAADLRRLAALDVAPSAADRERLGTMIRRSGNRAATATFALVGRQGLLAVARAVGMRGYTVGTSWGSSEVTATDQARLFSRLHAVLPSEHRAYARGLLGTIVRSQTWGGARVARRAGYTTLFKSGWLKRADGWVVHQGLRLERDGCTVGVAVLTGRQPDMSAGVRTIRGVVERLLASPPEAPSPQATTPPER